MDPSLVSALRPLLAGVAAWILTSLLMPAGLRLLRSLHLQQVIRRQGLAAHLAKEGITTSAGLLFAPAACLAAWAAFPRSPSLLAALVVTLGHAALGFTDDYLKIVRRRAEGLKARYKLVGQLLLTAWLVGFALARRPELQVLLVPFTDLRWMIGPLGFVALAALAVLGATNGCNFNDGADGLLGTTGAVALVALGAIVWDVGDPALAALALALAGSLLAFLHWNWHPARVFMGDTGSMAVGAALAAIAVLTATTLFLPLIGLLFLLEVLSVIVQVTSFRLTGHRVLRMSPLNHHLQLSGWREGRLVPRLLVFALACAAAGVLAYVR